MLRLLVFFFLCLLCPRAAVYAAPNTPPASAMPSVPGLGAVSNFTLPNGMQVLVAPSTASDLVTVAVWIGAGTRRETTSNNGAAHFMEHLLFKGTPTRKPGDIDAAIEDLGGTLNAQTSYDWAQFYTTVSTSDAPAALAVLADAVQNASLRAEDMDSERQVILSERARELSNPALRVTQASQALAFPGTPYGRPLLGSITNITTLTRETVAAFYKTYYVPTNTTLVLSGNLSADDGLAMAKRAFGAWPSRPVPADKPNIAPAVDTSARARTLGGGTDAAWLAVSFPAPPVSAGSDPYVCDVLLTYLGQGGNNVLDMTLQRQQKLVTVINANYLTQRDVGLLTITASCRPGDAGRAQAAILKAVRAVRDVPLSAVDLAAAKQSLMASYLFDAQTTSGRANALGFYNTIDTYTYDTAYLDHVRAVTAAQVQDVAKRYLTVDAPFVVTLLPRVNPLEASTQ